MRIFRNLFVLVAALSLTAALAQDYVFGITFDAGGKFDGSFNQGTFEGLQRAVDDLRTKGLEVDLLEFEGSADNAAEGQRKIAGEGAELIVAPGFAQADAISAVSKEFPDTSFVLIDAVADGENIRSIVFKEQEGSYLVGYIAGKLTQTGVLGFIGGQDTPLIHTFDLGYQEGVTKACPDCKIISNYVGVTPDAWNDPAKAKELATVQQAQGADIIYAAAGASGNGNIDFVNETMCYKPTGPLRPSALADTLPNIPRSAAEEAKCGPGTQPLFFIGVDSNQNPRGDIDGDPTTLNHGLTSMLKRVDVAAYNAAMDVVDGDFTGGTLNLGLAEDGVDYALDEYNTAIIPQALVDEVAQIKQQIIDGTIVVTDYKQQ